jgi:MoaA/NifB/PqqE/SkfB family radical SAM enzyme
MDVLIRAMRFRDSTDLFEKEYPEPFDTCPFIKKRSLSVRWDGGISPCPPLLHSHTCFMGDLERKNRECLFGSLKDHGLLEIWKGPEYTAFRKRVTSFDFSPCASCASCELAESNEGDCFGNPFPTCGGCLWAQGLIRCP